MNAPKYIKHFLFIAIIIAAQTAWGQTVTVTYTTPKNTPPSNVYPVTIPSFVTRIKAEAWGGGGGGSGASGNAILTGRGSGGGGGAYVTKNFIPVFNNNVGSAGVIVGTGGNGGNSSSNGQNGTLSSVEHGGSTITANGGNGGIVANAGTGGTGGSGGTFSGDGVVGYNGSTGGNGSGSESGPAGAGGNAGNTPPGGVGGTAIPGGTTSNGNRGSNPGGGGSGGRSQIWQSTSGGVGGTGQVVLTFSVDLPVIAGSHSVCEGEQLILNVHNPIASASYTWKQNGSTVGWGTTYTVSNTTTAQTGIYTVEASIGNYFYEGGLVETSVEVIYNDEMGTFMLTSPGFAVTVNELPVITDKITTICSGDLFHVQPENITPDIVPDGTTYNLSILSLPAGVTGTTSAMDLTEITGGLTNLTPYIQYVVYRVVPKIGNCLGDPFELTVRVNPKPNITFNRNTFVCSGGTLNYTPTPEVSSDIIPENTTYTWNVISIYPSGILSPLPINGSGETINIGPFTNNSPNSVRISYHVFPETSECGVATPFWLDVDVLPVPDIIVSSTTICSGDTLHLHSAIPGTFSSSDESIAWINPNTNLLYTDVDIDVSGNPIPRPDHDENEGKGGTVTITFTSDDGCIATKEITVTPRTKTPRRRRDYYAICPIDESNNLIKWDLLVVNTVRADVPIERIKWYADNNGSPGNFIRNGGETLPEGDDRLADFWQNIPHAPEAYWASITVGDSCQSRPIRIEVYIYELPEVIGHKDLFGYVQPVGTHSLDLLEQYLRPYGNINPGTEEDLEWYTSEADAYAQTDPIAEPVMFDPTSETDITYWLVKEGINGCRSLPTPFNVKLIPMPEISIAPDTLVCPGSPVTVRVNMSNGTAPYNFKIEDVNLGENNNQTGWTENIYTFDTNPLSTGSYRITEFSDANASLVTYPPYRLLVPATGYFDETTLSVVVTEITEIIPASGPTAGGIYTSDPYNPIDPTGTIKIIGSGFAPFGTPTVSQITFGGIPATNITVISNDTIICTPPAHVSGSVTVAVTTTCSTVTFTNGYTYEPINITGVSPDYGPVTGGTLVTIYGTGLSMESTLVTVTFAGVPAQIRSVSNTKIECITGPSNYSVLDTIIINNGSETRKFADRWTYYPVVFIENGKWSEPYRWETYTTDHILPYPGADIQIKANCLQDTDVDMDSITVYPSKAYSLNSGNTLKANAFILKDNASFLDNNPNNANMRADKQSVEHTLTGGRNWYISNPVSNTAGLTANHDWIEQYNEVSQVWERNPVGGLETGRGYTIYSAAPNIAVNFSGTYNDGNQQLLNLTRTNGMKPEYDGFNLVGNPYPSYWQWTETTSTNLYSTIWYRTFTDGIYEFWSYNASGGVAAMPGLEDATPTGSYSLGYIPPMQAFWVRVKDGQDTGTLTFTDNHRTHADHGSNQLKSADVDTETRPLLRLAVYNGYTTDETVIYADREAKKDFDTYDSDKWFVEQGAEIFTLPASSTRELVINGLPEITAGTEVALGFRTDEGGAFSFHAKEILNLDMLDVFLLDKWSNMQFDLRSGDYKFTSNSMPVTDRFSIVFHTQTQGDDFGLSEDSDKLFAYSGKNGEIIVLLHLRNQQGNDATVSIFDVAGRKISEQSVVVGELTALETFTQEGIYVLRSGKCVTKVIVKK